MKRFLFTFYLKLRKKSTVHIKGHYVRVVIWGSLEMGEVGAKGGHEGLNPRPPGTTPGFAC